MKKIKNTNFDNIFFDFNGTILDDVDLTYKIQSELSLKYHFKNVDKQFYLNNFCFPIKEYYKKIGFDFLKFDYNNLSQDFMKEYLNREEKETHLYKGTKTTLKLLKESGYRLYILSVSHKDNLKMQLRRLGILSLFDDFIGSSDIEGEGKLNLCLEYFKKNKINPGKSIMIGDTVHDYEVAQGAKMSSMLFSSGHNSVALLDETGAKVVKSYHEIEEYFLKGLWD